jgi:DNA-directed RNA polymerase specialized sigma24 family protein
MSESDAIGTSPKVWSISEDYEEFETRVHKAAWKVCRGYQDYEDTVQDMLLAIIEAQATEAGFARQTVAYQVTRAFWKAGDWRRHLADREAKHVRLDAPVNNGDDDGAVLADFLAITDGSELDARMAKTEVQEAMAKLAAQSEAGRKKAEILYRRFYGGQTVAEASKEMGLSKGNGCYFSAQGLKDLRVIMTGN